MTEHRYPWSAIKADYARATAGMILTFGPLFYVPAESIAGIVLLIVGVLFLAFALRTWDRQRLVIRLGDNGVTAAALLRKNIAWQDITALQLRYYAVKRDRSQGWMQLTLRSADSKMQMESTLEAFEKIVEIAARAAERNGIEFSPSTFENIRSLGLPTDRLQEGRETPVTPA